MEVRVLEHSFALTPTLSHEVGEGAPREIFSWLK
jgi:hypothetical protein